MLLHPFLTIGIPTWNRDRYLEKNLLALIEQIESAQLNNIEILISDNASDDRTQTICQRLAEQYPYLTYHRHPSNLGANVNFQTVIALAKGEYVWLLGDDDLLANSIIPQVTQDISHYNPDIIIGPALFDDTQAKATHLSVDKLTCINIDDFAKENIIEMAGKISGVIFKKSSILPILHLAFPIITETRTPWPHLAWILLLLNDPTKKILLLPYGTNQLVSEHWHNLLFTGKTLIQIHLIDYQNLLIALHSLLSSPVYSQLTSRAIAHRVGILAKCVLYATYLDPYWQTLIFAARFTSKIIGWQNKVAYILFLVIPLAIPTTFRKFLLQSAKLICVTRFEKLGKTLARIKQASNLLKDQLKHPRKQFDNTQL